jgi:hypothetical protein
VHAPEAHAWFVQAAAALHWPAELQVSTPLLVLHCVEPGVQAAQAPATHSGVLPLQAVAALQLPVASQVSTPLPEHRVAPGVHTPEQHAEAPPSQPVVAQT